MKKILFFALISILYVSPNLIYAQACDVSQSGDCDVCPGTQTCTYIDELNVYGCNTVPGQCGAPAAPSDDGESEEVDTPDYVEGDVGNISLSVLTNPATNFTNPETFIGNLLGGSTDTPGLLTIAIVGGAFLMLLMIIMGGFTMLTNPSNPQGQEQGRNQITWAIIGFAVLFSAFWIMEIIQLIFGVSVTNQSKPSKSPSTSKEVAIYFS